MAFPVPEWLRPLARLVRHASVRHDALHELRRRLRGEPPLPEGAVRRVLVVCHGNVCRSPFGEVLLAVLRPELDVRSAGLHAADGSPADPSAMRCAERMGVSLAEHRSRKVDAELLSWADLVLVMQGAHVAEIARAWPDSRARVRLLGDFLPHAPFGLPDPWGEDDAVFDSVFTRVRMAVEALAARIESRRGVT